MEKERGIVIIGTGGAGRTALSQYDVEIFNDIDKQNSLLSLIDPYVINNYPLETLSGQKDFICKGKHQYREVRETNDNVTTVNWVCQCGRKV